MSGPGPQSSTQEPDIDPALAAAFRDLPALPPPAGWEERVLVRTRARVRRVRAWVPVAETAAAASLLAGAWLVGRRTEDAERAEPTRATTGVVLALRTGPPGGPGVRAAGAAVGSVLEVQAMHGAGAPVRELRLYRGEHEVVLRCPGDAGCASPSGVLGGAWTTRAPGVYVALSLAGAQPLPAPVGTLSGDIEAALRGGATVQLSAPLDVH